MALIDDPILDHMAPKRFYNGTMAVTLSIKNVPEEVVERLRTQAKVNRRSLQGELLAIVERVAGQSSIRPLTVEGLHDWAKAQGFRGTGDSAEDIRRMRDERGRHLENALESLRARPQRTARMKRRGRR
jgi:hypothetical protein